MRRTTTEILLRLLIAALASALFVVVLIVWMASQALAAVDATVPLQVTDCTLASQYIRYDELKARMLQQFGAVQLKGELQVDSNRVMIEFYNPTGTSPETLGDGSPIKGPMIYAAILRPTKINAGDPPAFVTWESKPSSLACWFAYSDPISIPPATLK